MTAIIEGCPLLTDFSARRCLSITSTTLHSLGRRCNNLSTLVIAGCTNIALDGLITVSRMARRLQVIDASEVANSHSSNYFDCIKPNRLSNQWLSSITLDGCMFVTKQFLRELLGPLKGQVCPNLTALSLRDCPKIVDGFLERLILPMCPNLQALHYSAETKRSLISKVDLNGLSFFQGCRYAFPARSSRLPPLVQRLQRVLTQESQGKRETLVGQYDLQRIVFSAPKFLQSIQAFEANALARQALRSIQTLTISGSELRGHNLLELIISLPALRYLDVSDSHLDLRQLLLSCYYFHPLLETVIFSKTTQSQTVVVDVPDESVRRFQTRERRIRAKLLQTIEENAMLADQDVAKKKTQNFYTCSTCKTTTSDARSVYTPSFCLAIPFQRPRSFSILSPLDALSSGRSP